MSDYGGEPKKLIKGTLTELDPGINPGSSALGKYVEITYFCDQPLTYFYIEYDRAGTNVMWTEDSNNTTSVTGTRSQYLRHYAIYKGNTKVKALYNNTGAGASPTAYASYEANIGNLVYTDEEGVWKTAGVGGDVISRSDTVEAIIAATAEVDKMTERVYRSTQVTETYYGDETNVLMLDNYPVLSLDSLTIDGDSVTTSDVDVDLVTGRCVLSTNAEVTKFKMSSDDKRNISVTYTWGDNTVPREIRRFTECIAAINILAQQTGGTYNDITSFSIGGYTASLGEPYTNIRQTVSYLNKEINRLMDNIKKRISLR